MGSDALLTLLGTAQVQHQQVGDASVFGEGQAEGRVGLAPRLAVAVHAVAVAVGSVAVAVGSVAVAVDSIGSIDAVGNVLAWVDKWTRWFELYILFCT